MTSAAANAVARIDNLEFLADVVPKTMTLRQAKAAIAKEAATAAQVDEAESGAVNGHVTGSGRGDEMDVDPRPESSAALMQQQLELQLRSPRANGTARIPENGSHA